MAAADMKSGAGMQSLQMIEVPFSPQEAFTWALGALFLVLIGLGIYRNHRGTNAFNLMDLLMENGRASRLAAGYLTTLVVTSWMMIQLAVTGKLTEGYLGIYVSAWVAPIVAKLFAPPIPPQKPCAKPNEGSRHETG